METTCRTVLGAGIRLRVFEHRPSHAAEGLPTVVLVHGYPDTSAVWTPVVARLARDHHVVTYDVRGAGGSERPATTAGYALPLLVADLAAVVDAVRPEGGVHLVGHDWGAIEGFAAVTDPAVAARLASFTALSAPGLDVAAHRIRSAFMEGPSGWRGVARQTMRSWYIAAFQMPLLPRAVWTLGLARRWPHLQDGGTGPGHPARTLLADAVAGVGRYRSNRPAGAVSRLRIPTRVLVGSRDAFVTPWLFDRVGRLGDDVRVEVVEGGHWLPRSHPDLVAARVAATVSELSDASRW